jgi:hypothetical protein
MSFLLHLSSRASLTEQQARWREYRHFIETSRERLPRRAYEFAVAEWHYDPTAHQSPHDAWVCSLAIREPALGERSQVRNLEIGVELLGAYHDGTIRITYPGVTRYSLCQPWDRPSQPAPPAGHGDCLVDEVSPAQNSSPDKRLVQHEISFSNGSLWTIESEDITYEWLPGTLPSVG